MKGAGFSPYIHASQKEGALAPEGNSSGDALTIPPLTEVVSPEAESIAPAKLTRGLLEARMEAVLAALAEPSGINTTLRQGHLALLKRWYYRPEARRSGEIFFPDDKGHWPIKALLRGVGRIAGKMLVEGRGHPPVPR